MRCHPATVQAETKSRSGISGARFLRPAAKLWAGHLRATPNDCSPRGPMSGRVFGNHAEWRKDQMANDLEYSVHFQKGRRVGTRSTRVEHMLAVTASHAVAQAKAAFPDFRVQGYRIVRVDHFGEDGRIFIDMSTTRVAF